MTASRLFAVWLRPHGLFPNLPSFISRGLCPVGAGCKLGWRKHVDARMRSFDVVVDPTFFDNLARLVEVRDQVLIEALVA